MQVYRGTKMYSQVHAELVRAAQYGGATTYPDVAAIMELPAGGHRMRKGVTRMLQEICEDEVEAGRPMLSAVAVKTNRKPGHGFFDQARELGRLQGKRAEARFWVRERRAVYKEWKRMMTV